MKIILIMHPESGLIGMAAAACPTGKTGFSRLLANKIPELNQK